jgi:hypothetical protein
MARSLLGVDASVVMAYSLKLMPALKVRDRG